MELSRAVKRAFGGTYKIMSMRQLKRFLAIVLSVAILIPALPAAAASRVITDVVIEGNTRIPEETILATIKSQKGLIFDRSIVSEDVKNLYKLGQFSDIKVDAQQGPGGVALLYKFTEKPIISKIEFEGNRKLKEDDLRGEVSISTNSPLNEKELAESMAKIREKYAEKGYYLAQVTTDLQATPDGQAKLIFVIHENEGVQIRRIDFIGNRKFSDKDLRGIVGTKRKGMLSFFTGTGKFKEELLKQDVLRITLHYLNHGYLKVKVQPPRVTISKDKRYIFIGFYITEGKQYRLGKLTMSGDILTTQEELLSMMMSKSGEIYNQMKLEDDVRMLTDRYGDQGYAYATIVPQVVPNDDTLTADINFAIQKGVPITIERINILGNVVTRDKVIRREMKIVEDDRYSERLLRLSKERIMALGFFEEVNFATPRGSRDDTVVLNVTVKERSTGSFNIGAGFSSAEKFIINASVQKENAFGYGISAQISVEFSKLRQMFMLQAHDPYFLDTNWMLGGSIYRSMYRYTDFRRKAMGGDINLGRRFLDYYSVTLGYRLEDVKVDDFSFAVPQLFRQNSSGLTSAMSLTLAHDKRNNRYSPTKGTYNIGTVAISGSKLGGDNNFFKVDYRSMWYQPIWKSIVFKVFGRIGYIRSLDSQAVPLFERYFLGGPYSLRGYTPNTVGPRVRIPSGPGGPETFFTYGGNKELLFITELEFPIYDPAGLRWVVFFDAGNSFAENENYSFNNMRTDAGFGVRWNSPMGPLRFEFGFPFNRRTGDDFMVFNFSVGNFF